jgi:predicted double-glycine peptidase
VGHFVVLSGYDRKKRQVTVADPSHDNPRFRSHRYSVSMTRLITAIALGVMTYDANLLVLTPKPTLGETVA